MSLTTLSLTEVKLSSRGLAAEVPRLDPGLEVEDHVGEDEHAHCQPDDVAVGDDAAPQQRGVTHRLASVGWVNRESSLPPGGFDCSISRGQQPASREHSARKQSSSGLLC